MIPSVTPFFAPPDVLTPFAASVSAVLTNSKLPIVFHFLPYIVIILSALALGFAIYVFYLLIKHYLSLPTVLLEIKPPRTTQQSAFSTEQLFTTIHSLGLQTSRWQCFLGRKKLYTLELVATRDDGIRFCVRVHKDEADVIKKTLRAYLAGVTIREVEEYLPTYRNIYGIWNIVTFCLSNHFTFPLQKHAVLSEHDPIAYITTHMTKQEQDEIVVYQINVTPIISHLHGAIVKKLRQIDAHIYNGFGISHLYVESSKIVSFIRGIFKLFLAIFVFLATIPLGMLEAFTRDSHNKSPLLFPINIYAGKKLKRFHELSPQQQYEHKLVSEKIAKELFEASIRVFLVQQNTLSLQNRVKGFVTSLSPFNNDGYQSLRAKKNFPFINKLPLYWHYSYFLFRNRLLGFQTKNNAILTTAELSSLYHFPYFGTTQTEDIVNTKSPLLPAPLSQKRSDTILDVVIGNNTYGEKNTPVGLTATDRAKQTYIIGKSGMGKTTIMKQMAYQDIVSDKGVAVIDPHGDMVQELLLIIPKHRKKDVIYIDLSDKAFPFGLNILAPSMTFADADEEQEWICSTLISVFMKITPKEHWGQRMEHILRNATLTALQTKADNPLPYVSLFTIQKLLTDQSFRKTLSGQLLDPIIKQFWEKEYSLFGKMQQGANISPLTNKLGEFITSKLSRNILLQENTTLPVGKLMDSGKIILINLSKGKLGEERSAFFGTLFTALFQLATYQRASMPEKKRKDFFLYIDEFQNFASPIFEDLFSESRKFHVFLTLSHQTTAQIDDPKLTKILLSNTGNLIALATGAFDEELLLPFFGGKLTQGNLVNLPPHQFVIKVHNDSVDDAFTGETILLEEKEDTKTAKNILKTTRKHYTTPKEAVEKQLAKLFAIHVVVPKTGATISQNRRSVKNASGKKQTTRNTRKKAKKYGV